MALSLVRVLVIVLSGSDITNVMVEYLDVIYSTGLSNLGCMAKTAL